ncbi:MAG: twin-arginine translocase subunit TatC [Nitrososphaeria archaeon]|nr:twin-arginine translocase subunit TatC [Nitrososphaeria archaeon]
MSNDNELPIWDHLEELANRLRRVLLVVVVATVIIATFPSDLKKILTLDFSNYRPFISIALEFIQEHLLPEGVSLIAFNWLDTFYIYVLISIALGALITLPYIVYEIYKFVSPALYPHEKKPIYTFVIVITLLFSIGAVYAWFILLPTTFNVLYRFVYQSRVIPFFSVKDFYNMVTFGLLGSGIFYTFPIVVWMLVEADLIETQTLKESRKQLFVALIIVTAVLTPDPTPFSMLLMSVPFYLLYEITIQVLSRTKRRKEPDDKTLEIGLRASKELLARIQARDAQKEAQLS